VSADKRREAFIALCQEFYYATEEDANPDSTGEEDALNQLWGDDDPIERYAIVLQAGESVSSILARASTLAAAKDDALEHINDDIFAESPHKIVDLDTGATWWPRWETLQWREVTQSRPATPVVVVIRDPDSSNEFVTFGSKVEVYDIDLGRMNLADEDEFAQWADGHLSAAADFRLAGRNDVADAISGAVREAAANFGHAAS
jgi:hypothetical protein